MCLILAQVAIPCQAANAYFICVWHVATLDHWLDKHQISVGSVFEEDMLRVLQMDLLYLQNNNFSGPLPGSWSNIIEARQC